MGELQGPTEKENKQRVNQLLSWSLLGLTAACRWTRPGAGRGAPQRCKGVPSPSSRLPNQGLGSSASLRSQHFSLVQTANYLVSSVDQCGANSTKVMGSVRYNIIPLPFLSTTSPAESAALHPVTDTVYLLKKSVFK